MKNRPWPLVLLAVLQILSPAFSVLFNTWALKVGPGQVMSWVMDQRPLQIFEFLLLTPIAGIAIFMMKRWSYAVFCGTMLWSLISKIQSFSYAQDMLPWPTLVFVYGIEIALVSYFMLPAVRATYFNPRVRWWESKPRYELKLPAHLKVGVESLDAQVVNVSEGGVFIRTGRNLPLGDSVGLRFEILGQAFEVDGRIVHVRKAVDSGAGVDAFWHGMEFAHTFDTSRRFQGLSKALRELGFQDRTPREPLFVSFKDWTSNLLRTGKGLTPDLGTRPKG